MTTTTVGHTPGPWKAEMGFVVAAEPWDKMYVARAYEPQVMEHLGCFGPSQSFNDVADMAAANARLIAAAPEMLEALKAARAELSFFPYLEREVERLIEDAIAKATGDA
jgi:hypothetical protein